jgi:AhpD family alkylhydroperoxidase
LNRPGETGRLIGGKPRYNKNNLSKIEKMNTLAPELMKAFWAFDKAAVADGAIPVKDKELIAVAVAVTTQCPYCIDIHSTNARKAGATEPSWSKRGWWRHRFGRRGGDPYHPRAP